MRTLTRLLARPHRLIAGVVLTAATFFLLGCPPPPPDTGPEPGAGGSQCFQAFDFDEPVGQFVIHDGQNCPNPFAPCATGDDDWPVSTEVQSYTGGPILATTQMAHYRLAPPVPPTESDLYLSFELEQASVNDIGTVTVALSPGGTATDGRLVRITPFATTQTGSAKGEVLGSAEIDLMRWNGSSWTSWSAPSSAVAARAAYEVSSSYWGVEVKLHLADFGITGQKFFMATYRRSEPDVGGAAIGLWTPNSAKPGDGDPEPGSDPTTWTLYSFGTDCAPDVWIDSEWNTCADIYITERGPHAREIAINNTNEFHAVVHGDDDAGDPDMGGTTAQDVQVYMDISHLGNGDLPWAMNYPHTNANINWENAAHSLATASPEPPTPFDIAAGATDDQVRVKWRPADESPNPFAEGEHVCVNAFVYFKDDPYLDNNFGQCNMGFVPTVPGRPLSFTFPIGSGFRGFDRQEVQELVLVPQVVNSGFRLRDSDQLRFRIEAEQGDVGRVDSLSHRIHLVEPGQPIQARVTFTVPEEIFSAPSKELLRRHRALARTREFYGDRPLVILQSFVPRTTTVGQRRIRVLQPGSYIGWALERNR